MVAILSKLKNLLSPNGVEPDDENVQKIIGNLKKNMTVIESGNADAERKFLEMMKKLNELSLEPEKRESIFVGKKVKSLQGRGQRGFKVLCDVLKEGRVEMQVLSAAVLANIALELPVAKGMISNGIFEALKKLQRESRTSLLLAEVARIYANLGGDAELRAKIMGLPPGDVSMEKTPVPRKSPLNDVVVLAQNHSAEVSASAVGCLANLALVDDYIPYLVDKGMVPVCRGLLTVSYHREPEAQSEALRGLANLCSSADVRTFLLDHGVSPDLARLLNNPHISVQRNAALLTANLCAQNEAAAISAAKYGCAKTLLALVCSNDKEAQFYSARALRAFTSARESRDIVMEAAATEPLCTVAATEDVDTRVHVLASLRAIAMTGESARQEMGEADLLPRLCGTLREPTLNVEPEEQVEHIMAILGQMALDRRWRKDIYSQNLAKLISFYARSESSRIKYNALVCLRILATDGEPSSEDNVDQLLKQVQHRQTQARGRIFGTIKEFTNRNKVKAAKKDVDDKLERLARDRRTSAVRDITTDRNRRLLAITRVQAWYRGWKARRVVRNTALEDEVHREVRQILRIDPQVDKQNLYEFLKGEKLRRTTAAQTRRKSAAIDIQRLYRGYNARKERAYLTQKKAQKTHKFRNRPSRNQQFQNKLSAASVMYLNVLNNYLSELREEAYAAPTITNNRGRVFPGPIIDDGSEMGSDYGGHHLGLRSYGALSTYTNVHNERYRRAAAIVDEQERRSSGSTFEGKTICPPRAGPSIAVPDGGKVALSLRSAAVALRLGPKSVVMDEIMDERPLSYFYVEPGRSLDLSFTNLGPHTHIAVSANLLTLGKWLGNVSSHFVRVTLDNITVFNETFSTQRGCPQSFDNIETTAAFSSAVVRSQNNPTGWGCIDRYTSGAYRYRMPSQRTRIPHAGPRSKLRVSVGGIADGGLGVEKLTFVVMNGATPMTEISFSARGGPLDGYVVYDTTPSDDGWGEKTQLKLREPRQPYTPHMLQKPAPARKKITRFERIEESEPRPSASILMTRPHTSMELTAAKVLAEWTTAALNNPVGANESERRPIPDYLVPLSGSDPQDTPRAVLDGLSHEEKPPTAFASQVMLENKVRATVTENTWQRGRIKAL